MSPEAPKEAFSYKNVYRSTPVPSCHLSRDDLVRLYEELASKAREGLESSLDGLEKPTQITEEAFEKKKEDALKVGKLSAMIYGAGGDQIAVSSADDFSSQSLPDEITSITYDSAASLEVMESWKPENRFRLTFDFTEPPGFDQYDPTSSPTPNNSSFEITGPDSTWVTGVHETVMGFFESRRTRRGWLHRHGTYNLYHWFLAVPGALWVAVRVSEGLSSTINQWHMALQGALYVYLFLIAFLLARGVALGFRWAYPLVELEGSRSTSVRRAVTALLVAVLLGLVSDIVNGLVLG